MNIFRPALVLALIALTGCTRTWVEPAHQRPADFATWVDTPSVAYRIQPGDELSIVFPMHTELNYRGTVAPDGLLALPFAGTIPAGGQSASQLGERIDRTLAANGVASNTHASVGVVQSGAHVYVGGQVGHAGEVPLRPGMSVMQAIISAQGLLDTARTHEVVVIRRAPDGRPMLRTVDIDGLTQRGDPQQEIVLQASDTVFVPKSSIAEVDQWVDQYIDKVLPFNRGFDYTISNNPVYP
jgi:polysaccharide biosynthesis/export protein PslD